MLKVFGKASSINVRKVLWACDEIDIPYEREDWGSGFRSTRAPEFLARNPNGLVPLIRDGDFYLWESNTIIRYLAAAYGDGNLLPAAPRERALVEKWMDWQATEFNNAWSYAFQALVRRSPDHANPADIARSCAEWNRHVAIVDRQLQETGGYIAGRELTLADIPIGLSLNRWKMTPMERPAFAAVSSYFDALSERPAFRRHGCNGTP